MRCTALHGTGVFGVQPGPRMIRENESYDLNPYLVQAIRCHHLLKSHRQSLRHLLPTWIALHASSELGVGTRAPQRSQIGSELELALCWLCAPTS